MRTMQVFLAGCVLAVGGCASVGTQPNDLVATALASPTRSDADRERDARDQPREILTLAAYEPGMTVADIFGGGGYYSEIIAGIVGPTGKVLLINNPPYDNFAKKGLATRLAGNRLPNVKYEVPDSSSTRS